VWDNGFEESCCICCFSSVVAGVCAYFIVKRRIGGSREESVFRAAILYDNFHGPPEGFSGALEVFKELSDDTLLAVFS